MNNFIDDVLIFWDYRLSYENVTVHFTIIYQNVVVMRVAHDVAYGSSVD